MKIIYKYPLPYKDNTFNVLADGEILTVQVDQKDGNPYIWILGDIDKPLVSRTFVVIGTGNDIHQEYMLKYVGTFQKIPFVWHVFELFNNTAS